MQFFKKIVDFYIFSNIHVAIAGFCLTEITLDKFEILESLTSIFVALSIVISYNFIRFFEIKYRRLEWFKNWFLSYKKSLLVLSLLSALLLVRIVFFSSFKITSLIILFPFAFMTLFYVIPLFKIGKIEFSFRNFPSIKIISIAIAWAGITVLFPLYEAGYEFNSIVYLEFAQRFLFLMVIIIPFDIRDVYIDSKSLKTIPQLLGVSNSKILGYLLLMGFVLLEFLKGSYTLEGILTLLIISIITALFLAFSSAKRTRYYTSFWVESIPLVWFGLISLFL